jgi:hypothetical protein
MPDTPWIEDDGTDRAWSLMGPAQRATLSPTDPRHGHDGMGRSGRGRIPTARADGKVFRWDLAAWVDPS